MNSLAFDSERNILYIGGVFHSIDGTPISPGLAMWSNKLGLVAFPGGGVTNMDNAPYGCSVKSIAFEKKSKVLTSLSSLSLLLSMKIVIILCFV